MPLKWDLESTLGEATGRLAERCCRGLYAGQLFAKMSESGRNEPPCNARLAIICLPLKSKLGTVLIPFSLATRRLHALGYCNLDRDDQAAEENYFGYEGFVIGILSLKEGIFAKWDLQLAGLRSSGHKIYLPAAGPNEHDDYEQLSCQDIC